MNQISRTNSFFNDTLPEIPNETIVNIFDHLDLPDLRSAAKVNTLWNATTIDFARIKDYGGLKKVVSYIHQNLDSKYNEHKEALGCLLEEIKSNTNFTNLIEIETTIYNFREIMANILKELDDQDLAQFSEVDTDSVFMKNFIALAIQYKKLDTIFQMNDLDRRELALAKCSAEITGLGNFKKMAEIIDRTISNDNREQIYNENAAVLIKQKKYEHALPLIQNSSTGNQIKLYRDAAYSLKNDRKYEEAEKFANLIPFPSFKEDALKTIAMHKMIYLG